MTLLKIVFFINKNEGEKQGDIQIYKYTNIHF